MPVPYSIDLRERLIRCYEQGKLSQEAVAKRFSVSERTFKRWWKHYQREGTLAPDRMGDWVNPKVGEAQGERLRACLKEKPELTLVELCQRYEKIFGMSMSHSAMARGLKRLEVSHKKTFYDPEKKSPRVQALRAAYREKRAKITEETLIFTDESGASLDLTCLFGWAPRDERAYGEKPTGVGGRISTIGALSLRGLRPPCALRARSTAPSLLFFLEHFLCPRLQPGQWVVMDNARAHHVDRVRYLIERTGARVLYLPPYSPEYNSIELACRWLSNA